MTTRDKNIAIANFMGYEIRGNDFIFPKEMYPLYKPTNLYEFEDGSYNFEVDTHDMEFHRSWDWLMPVVRKILQESDPLWLHEREITCHEEVAIAVLSCSIELTHEAVYLFIQSHHATQS